MISVNAINNDGMMITIYFGSYIYVLLILTENELSHKNSSLIHDDRL